MTLNALTWIVIVLFGTTLFLNILIMKAIEEIAHTIKARHCFCRFYPPDVP